MKQEIDLFEHMDELPALVRNVISKYENAETYFDLINMGKEMAIYGYEFEFYLDCVPYNLKKINN